VHKLGADLDRESVRVEGLGGRRGIGGAADANPSEEDEEGD
jgi:hypothetical protein